MREGNSIFNKIKNLIREAKGVVFTLVIIAAVVIFFWTAVGGAAGKADSSSASTLEKAIKRAAVQCYAIEGFYPPSVSYLEDNYGIIIDRDKFIVEYKCDIGNNLPIIKVLY